MANNSEPEQNPTGELPKINWWADSARSDEQTLTIKLLNVRLFRWKLLVATKINLMIKTVVALNVMLVYIRTRRMMVKEKKTNIEVNCQISDLDLWWPTMEVSAGIVPKILLIFGGLCGCVCLSKNVKKVLKIFKMHVGNACAHVKQRQKKASGQW